MTVTDRSKPDRPTPDRTAPPPATERSEFVFPSFETHRLDNGLKLYLAPTDGVPLIAAELLTPAGGQHGQKPGVARLTAEMLDEGTEHHTAIELAERIETLGGNLSSGTGWNMASVGVDLLSNHLDEGLELIARCALEPAFPEHEVDRLRDETLADLLRRRDLPSALAADAFARAIYGDQVYGTPLLGTEESVRAITRDDLVGFYERHAVPSGSALLVAGRFDPDQVRERIDALFGHWRGGPEPEDPEITPRQIEGPEIYVVDRPGAAQSVLQLGCAGPPRAADDYNDLLLGNLLFGGNFSSRINLNLRERHGYTYGANSHLQRRRGPGPFFVRTNVATEHVGASAREVFTELDRLRNEVADADEIRDTKEYLLGVFPTSVQKVSSLLLRLEALVVHRLEDDHYDGYLDRLEAITAEGVRDAAERYLDPERFAVVAVGPAEELVSQLEGLGRVQVVGSAG